MFGIVLISHGSMSEGMINSASMLYPNLDNVDWLSLLPEDNPDDFQSKLENKIKEVDTGDGVFLLCDIFGGTPSNRAIYSLREKVCMLSGMSLPMLLTLLSVREDTDDIRAAADEVLEETLTGTMNVNDMLRKNGLLQ